MGWRDFNKAIGFASLVMAVVFFIVGSTVLGISCLVITVVAAIEVGGY